MRTTSCPIIKDLLPLYVDDVVSEETKEMVKAHLEHCEECAKDAELMRQEITLPVEHGEPLKRIGKRWRNKKLFIASLSILLTGLILFGAFFFVFHYDTVIPYSDSLISIETSEHDQLVSRYYGESYYSVNVTAPMPVTLNGEEKRVIFLYYTKTIADSPTHKLFANEDMSEERYYTFSLDHISQVDAVYYADGFDSRRIFDEGGNWNTVVEKAELIWEK